MTGLQIVLFITLTTCVSGQLFDTIIKKPNLGYVLRKTGQIHVSTAMAKMIFHYELPYRMISVDRSPINCSVDINRAQCVNIVRLLHTFRDLRIKIQTHVQTQIDTVYEMLSEFPTTTRLQKRGWFTDGLSKLTGLATIDDVNDMDEILRNVEKGVQQAAEAWKSGTSHILAAFRVEQVRTDNVYSVLNMHRTSILRLQSQLSSAFARANTRVHMLTKITETLTSLVFQSAEVDDLYNGMQLLSAGKLSHFFLHHKTLVDSIDFLQNYLKRLHPDLTLLRTDLQYYYQHAVFRAFRYNYFLIIVLDVPLTTYNLKSSLGIYKLLKLPVVAPHSTDHYTMLATDFQAILYDSDIDYYVEVSDMNHLPKGDVLNIRDTDLILKSRNMDTCSTALITGNLAQIKQLCKYNVYLGPIPRNVFQLSDDMFLFSNITNMKLICNGSEVYSKRLQDIQSVHKIHCSCTISADEFQLIQDSMNCNTTENVTFTFEAKYLINKPYLSEFFDQDIFEAIEDDMLLNESIPAVLPQLLVASKAYDAKLAKEHKYAFDLQTVINQTKDDEMMFQSLSHYLYNVLLTDHTHNKTFDLFNIFDWLLLLATVAGITALIMVIILRYRLRTVMILLASAQRAHAVENVNEFQIPTAFHYTTAASVGTSNLTLFNYYGDLREIFPVELTLLLCFILFLISVFVCLLYRYYNRRTCRTIIMLEVGNQKTSYWWNVAKLPYTAEFYRIVVDKPSIEITLLEWFLKAFIRWTNGVTIYNVLLDCQVKVPERVTVQPWQVYGLRRLMAGGRFHAVLHIINSGGGGLIDLVLLKGYTPTVKAGVTASACAPSAPNYHAF